MADYTRDLQRLVAHYIASSYPTALSAFLQATGLPPPDLATPLHPDLRTLYQDFKSSSLADAVKDLNVDDADGRIRPKDLVAIQLDPGIRLDAVVRNIDGVSATNLLCTLVTAIPTRRFDTTTASSQLAVLVSSVDKNVSVIDYSTEEVIAILEPHRAAVLSMAHHPIHSRYLLTGSMDGTTVLTDLITQQPVQTFQSSKFVVRVAFSACGKWLATASYDKQIVIYGVAQEEAPEEVIDELDDPFLACEPALRYEERQRIKVDHNPEALLFFSEWLIYTTRTSHVMSYVSLIGGTILTKSFNHHPLDTHISFSVLNMALHPNGKIIACQTGDHAGNTGERILIYGAGPDERLGCIWTGGDNDDYVLPRMAWLPDGTGIITTSANGLLHLLSLAGELRSTLKVHGATDGSNGIIRDCAIVDREGEKWEVLSVGYDRVVRISR